MSTVINDTGATPLQAAPMPLDQLSLFRQIATTGKWTCKNDEGVTVTAMGSELLYMFYGGKQVPDMTISTPDYWWLTSTTIHRNAAQIGPGQSVVVIVNTMPDAVTVTRPYRDGGYMNGIPYDMAGTANRIPGKQQIGDKDFFAAGAYINDYASLFYGSGAVLHLTSEGKGVTTVALAYGCSINNGGGLGISADASTISDAEDWFGETGNKDNFTPGGSLTDASATVKVTASAAPWDRMDDGNGWLVLVLLEPA